MRQKFLELVLKQYCPTIGDQKLKGLCKTCWVERHSCFKTFDELYEHVALFVQRLMKVFAIGIVTPKLRLMV